MRTVTVEQLRNNLSEYLREVRLGETVLVTERGEIVAQLGPAGAEIHQSSPADRVLRRLIASGFVQPSSAEADDPFPELTRDGVSDFDRIWDEGRKDRL